MTPDYSFFNNEELIELLEDRDHTLSYQQDTINMLKEENQTTKHELYNLVPRAIAIEKVHNEIKQILGSSTACSVKVTNINNVMEGVYDG